MRMYIFIYIRALYPIPQYGLDGIFMYIFLNIALSIARQITIGLMQECGTFIVKHWGYFYLHK